MGRMSDSLFFKIASQVTPQYFLLKNRNNGILKFEHVSILSTGMDMGMTVHRWLSKGISQFYGGKGHKRLLAVMAKWPSCDLKLHLSEEYQLLRGQQWGRTAVFVPCLCGFLVASSGYRYKMLD